MLSYRQRSPSVTCEKAEKTFVSTDVIKQITRWVCNWGIKTDRNSRFPAYYIPYWIVLKLLCIHLHGAFQSQVWGLNRTMDADHSPVENRNQLSPSVRLLTLQLSSYLLHSSFIFSNMHNLGVVTVVSSVCEVEAVWVDDKAEWHSDLLLLSVVLLGAEDVTVI